MKKRLNQSGNKSGQLSDILSNTANKSVNLVNSLSKEKYVKGFQSNIFFVEKNDPNNSIKVIRKEVPKQFIPKYKNDGLKSIERKINHLGGDSKEIIYNNQNMNKGNVQNQLYKKVMEDNITSSLGFYSKEQINYRKRDVCSSAKERYYSSLTATNPIFLDYETEKKSQKPLFTSEKISKYDDSKVEYKKDSRTFLYDNLYSNKVFPTNKVRIY